MAALSTVRGVEIARTGTWNASTGPWTCTREQLADAVRAQTDPAFRAAVLKVGHVDERFDGEPAVGRVTNLRLSADGEALLVDFEQVPTWLAEVMPSAYPSRSVEMLLNVEVGSTTYAAVLTGVALLGVTAPAIESLADVAALYEQPVAVDAWVAAGASRVAAAFTTPPAAAGWPPLPDLTAPLASPLSASTGGTMPTTDPTPAAPTPTPPAAPAAGTKVAAAASIESLRTAFYEWVRDAGDDERGDLDSWAWITEVWTEALIVDDDEGHLWRVPWTESDGAFTFGVPQKVTRTYVPVADTIAARAAHSAHRPLRYFRGRGDVSASTPEETPAVSENPAIAQALRDRLGLGADVDDEAVLAALDEKLKAPQTPAPVSEPATPADTTTTEPPAAPVAGQDDIAERIAAAVAPFARQVETLSTELAASKAEKAAEHKARVIDGAVKAGKITPADRAKWEADYDAAPAVIEGLLGRMAAGTAVPVQAAGSVGAEPTGNSEDEQAYKHVAGLLQMVREG